MIDRRVLLPATGCVLFGAVILLELGAGTTHPIPTATVVPKKADSAAAVPSDTRAEPNQLISTILARPLFSATRRPTQTADKDVSGFELGGARLTGIVIAPDERLAIFDIKGSKPLVLNEGETVSGWRVDSIAPTEVSLVGPGGLKTLEPKLDPAHTVSSASPATAVPPPLAPGAPIRPRGPGREPQH